MRIGRLTKCLLAGALLLNSAAYAAGVRVPEGMRLRVRLKADLLSENIQQGNRVDMEVAEPVVVNGQIVIPEGAVVWGAVQEVRKHRFIRFDIEGVRLANLQQIKLRCLEEQARNPDKDMIRVENKRGDDVGLARGALFDAYTDSAANIEVAPPPALKPAKEAAQPPPPAPKPEPAFVTVQCFSDPMGADILIDGEYVGNTPSILKVKAERHKLEFQLSGYSTLGQILDLSTTTGLKTIRVTLEKVQ